ncbi:hypothetical protein Tco_0059388 [Tanacetum coccineum]
MPAVGEGSGSKGEDRSSMELGDDVGGARLCVESWVLVLFSGGVEESLRSRRVGVFLIVIAIDIECSAVEVEMRFVRDHDRIQDIQQHPKEKPKHKGSNHALMESILADEDAMDKGVADIQKKRKPDDADRDEDPPAGPD